jgi:hypothetical protein
MPAQRIPLDSFTQTGPNPTRDNWAGLMEAYSKGKPGDQFVLATNQDTNNYGQITAFRRPMPRPPNGCSLVGAGDCAAASGVLRLYDPVLWNEPFVPFGLMSTTIKNFTIYTDARTSGGAYFGIIGERDEFIIHPHADNIMCTTFGEGTGQPKLACTLDGMKGDYASMGRGIRGWRLNNIKAWRMSYAGLYLGGALDGFAHGVQLVPDTLDFWGLILDGTPTHPSYSNEIHAQGLCKVFAQDSFENMVYGPMRSVRLWGRTISNHFESPRALVNQPESAGADCFWNTVDAGKDEWTQDANGVWARD